MGFLHHAQQVPQPFHGHNGGRGGQGREFDELPKNLAVEMRGEGRKNMVTPLAGVALEPPAVVGRRHGPHLPGKGLAQQVRRPLDGAHQGDLEAGQLLQGVEKCGRCTVVPLLQGQRSVAALELDVDPRLHLKRRLEYDPQRPHNSVVE